MLKQIEDPKLIKLRTRLSKALTLKIDPKGKVEKAELALNRYLRKRMSVAV